jgi:hypothetical protein
VRRLVPLLLLLLFGFGLAALGAERTGTLRSRLPPEEDVLLLPRSGPLRVMSLGQHELAADLVYIRAVIYFGTEAGGKRDYRWLENYLQTIVDLDPQWKTPYRWAGIATMYNGNTIRAQDVELSNHFLRLGAEHFPNDWELAFMLGCNYLFEMKWSDEAARARNTAEGVEWVRRAALLGGAPPWAALLAATILRKEGRDEAALHHLEQVYYATSDEQTRADVRARLISLKAKIDFARADEERNAFDAAWHADLPYVPPALFAIIGTAPDPRLDWLELGTRARLALGAPTQQ